MKSTKRIRITESELRNIVAESVKRALNESAYDEDDKQTREKKQKVQHTARAFIPGDKILYWRSVSGKPSAKFTATVVSVDGNTLTINEDGVMKTLAATSENIITNSAWVKPLKSFMHGSNELPSFYYRVDYENDKDGNVMVTIMDSPKQKKYWYTHDNGEFVKVEDTNRSYISQWKGKPNTPFPIKVNSETAQGFVDLNEDWFLLDKMGKFYAWRIEKRSKIAEACPWLRDMETRWKGNNWPKAVMCNPYKIEKK